jgi:hypothetical protein
MLLLQLNKKIKIPCSFPGRKNVGKNYHVAMLTMEPQQRTIYTNLTKRYARVWFPHLAFIIQYQKHENGCYYGGLLDGGLRVLVRNKPFTATHNVFAASPTEWREEGFCCTPHFWDRLYVNEETLFGTVLDVWWQTTHDNLPQDWLGLSLERVLAKSWRQIIPTKKNTIAKMYPELAQEKFLNQPVKLPSVYGM